MPTAQQCQALLRPGSVACEPPQTHDGGRPFRPSAFARSSARATYCNMCKKVGIEDDHSRNSFVHFMNEVDNSKTDPSKIRFVEDAEFNANLIIAQYLRARKQRGQKPQPRQQQSEPEPVPQVAQSQRCECAKLMCENGISNAKEFRRWSLQNHPDKGGDTAAFQAVSSCSSDNVQCGEEGCMTGGARKILKSERKSRKTLKSKRKSTRKSKRKSRAHKRHSGK